MAEYGPDDTPELPYVTAYRYGQPLELPEVGLGIDEYVGQDDTVNPPREAGSDPYDDDELSTEDIRVDERLVVEADSEVDKGTEITTTGERAGPAPTKIAGVTRVPISDALPHYTRLEGSPPTYNGVLEKSIAYANETFAINGTRDALRGRWDTRIAHMEVWANPRDEAIEYDKPTHTFLLNGSLMGAINDATAAKGGELTINELRDIGMAETEGAVRPDFAPDAMNDINASYYASGVAFSSEASLAPLFATNRPLNRALGAMMVTESGATDTLKVKELCSGNRTAHWAFEAQGALGAGVQQVEVTLSDFVTPTIEPETAAVDGVSIQAEQYSLLDDMSPLPDDQRFDAMITTYGFDSVTQDGDVHISKLDGQAYQTLYRVKVADWNERKDELVDAMRRGEPLLDATAAGYDGIYVERAMEPIDLKSHPYGKYIEDHPGSTVIVPGGLINRVVNAFKTQLKPTGVFVSGDVGDFGLIESTEPDEQYVLESDLVSGVAARYRCDDYVLVKKILEGEYGLEVTLMGLDELADTYLPGWKLKATGQERDSIASTPTNGVMIVKRRQPAYA